MPDECYFCEEIYIQVMEQGAALYWLIRKISIGQYIFVRNLKERKKKKL